IVGAVGGGMLEAEAWYWQRARGVASPMPRALASCFPSAHADVVGSVLGLGGPRETAVTAGRLGAAAPAVGGGLGGRGVVPVALAGGIDALTRICFMGFNTLKLLDPTPCRPFDRERRGMSIGEGAAFVVLEDVERARARDARVYAELTGHGMSTDAFHVTSPHPDGEGMVRP